MFQFRKTIVLFSAVLAAGAFAAPRPNAERFPNLVQSWDVIQQAKGHLRAAEEAHRRHGTLGGHGANAMRALEQAELELDLAVQFAQTHRKPGMPGMVTPKPALTAAPDDARYPNLGEARLQAEWAIRHVENAMQYHGPIGTLGGHGERAVEHLREALRQINQAERWADTHR